MTPEAWTFLGGCVATIGTIIVSWISTRRRSEKLSAKVDQVAEYSRPTGNGFADKVINKLEEVLAKQKDQDTKLQKVMDDQETQKVEHARLSGMFQGHMQTKDKQAQ